MENLALLWLSRLGALLCAAGAGWAMGRSVPGWEADQASDEYDPGPWTRRRGCLPGGSGLSGGFRGWGWGSGLSVMAVILASLACPPDNVHDDGSNFLLLFQPWFWCMLASALIGYIVAVFTDKGPVGPLE